MEDRCNAAMVKTATTVNTDPSVDSLTSVERERLKATWFKKYEDIFQEQPAQLPPNWQIQHHIPLIDTNKQYEYYLPKCADKLCVKLLEKIWRYTEVGWWILAAVHQAAPMLCIPKKNGTLHTTIDLQKQNNNTYKDVTPFPDQDNIRNNVTKAKYRSKIDLTNAYEQILIADEDLAKTAFVTVFGTFYSHVMQIGDCNAPAMFQMLMMHIFQDYLRRFVHVYVDNIFIYSDTVEEHEKHLEIVFSLLRQNEFYLKEEKVQLYAELLDCLSNLIDDRGIHMTLEKMEIMRNWQEPQMYNDVQQFLRLIQYISHFLPEVANYTGPLSAMTANGQSFH